MLRADALARLRLNTQADTSPTLAEAELGIVLDQFALMDGNGVAPTELGWLGVWDIQGASRKGWLIKAGKVVPHVTYDADGARYDQSDVHAHCLAMAQQFGSLGTVSIGL